MLFIPLAAIPSQTLNIVLDGQDCTISLYWRQERLYLDLISNGQAIVVGAICENKANVLQTDHLYFKGSLHFFDSEGDSPPRYEGLNYIRWVLVFIAEDEDLPESLRF